MQRLLRHSFELGINLFDTADIYTQGDGERLLGEAFHRDRDKVVFATKFGYRLPTQKRLISHFKPLVKPILARLGATARHIPTSFRGSVSNQDFSAAHIEQAIEASLRRLRTDYIDIYQLHSPSTTVLEGGDFVPALDKLQQQGKIRYWGVACEQAEHAMLCLEYPTLSAVQVPVSFLEPQALQDAIPRAAARGIGVIARQIFASGLLTKPVEQLDIDQLDPDPIQAERKSRTLDAYQELVARTQRTRAELAMSYVLAHEEVSVAVLGMHSEAHLAVNMQALARV
jgi:aryl-alcohol dehydrogenase-like predicted oxidoreductase